MTIWVEILYPWKCSHIERVEIGDDLNGFCECVIRCGLHTGADFFPPSMIGKITMQGPEPE